MGDEDQRPALLELDVGDTGQGIVGGTGGNAGQRAHGAGEDHHHVRSGTAGTERVVEVVIFEERVAAGNGAGVQFMPPDVAGRVGHQQMNPHAVQGGGAL